MVKVIVISDITIYREGLSQVLSRTGTLQVTGAYGSAQAAIAEITSNPPEVVVLDMTMANSCNLAQCIAHDFPAAKIVALAVPYDENNIVGCAEAGITGYVPREGSLTDLYEAVINAAKGECYCPPRIAAYIIKKVQHFASSAKSKYLHDSSARPIQQSTRIALESLTRRERQIATLLSDGLSNKQIARVLSIELSTVKNHVHSVLVKLDVTSRTQAVSVLQQLIAERKSESLDLEPVLKISS